MSTTTPVAARALAFVAFVPAVAAFGGAALVSLAPLTSGPDVHVEASSVVLLEAFVVAHLIVVGYVIWGLSQILSGERGLWWRMGCAYVLGIALTYVVWLLWVRHFSGG